MNGTPDNILVNSCELTPIYLIQDSGVAQVFVISIVLDIFCEHL